MRCGVRSAIDKATMRERHYIFVGGLAISRLANLNPRCAKVGSEAVKLLALLLLPGSIPPLCHNFALIVRSQLRRRQDERAESWQAAKQGSIAWLQLQAAAGRPSIQALQRGRQGKGAGQRQGRVVDFAEPAASKQNQVLQVRQECGAGQGLQAGQGRNEGEQREGGRYRLPDTRYCRGRHWQR